MASKQNQGNKGAAGKSTPRKGGRPGQKNPPPPPSPYPGGSGGGESTNNEAEPPIIVQGGSLTIESPVFLSVTTEERIVNGRPHTYFIYKNDTVNIREFVAKGRGNPHRDPTNNGLFNIKLER